MIWLPTMVLGALWGALYARRHGGKPKDMAQYAAVFAIGLGLLSVLLSIVIDRQIH